MKKTIISRYELTETGQAVIDVSIPSVEHLYHNFDKTAPYYRKELDQEFADYLIECVHELRKHPFIIQISLEKTPEDTLVERVKNSVNNYFRYLKEIEIRSVKQLFRRFVTLFGIGIVLLVFAILVTRRLTTEQGVMFEVFSQGLTIAAWVSLWEAFANLFLEWHPHKNNIWLYNQIINSQIIFRPLQKHPGT